MSELQPSGCLSPAGHGLENTRGDKVRIFRAEKSYAITQGKWYFEFEAVTTGEMRVGWARPNVRSDTELGADELAYVFNGNKVSHFQSHILKYCLIDLCKNCIFTIPFLGSKMAYRQRALRSSVAVW